MLISCIADVNCDYWMYWLIITEHLFHDGATSWAGTFPSFRNNRIHLHFSPGLCWSILGFLCNALSAIVCIFVPFLLAILLYLLFVELHLYFNFIVAVLLVEETWVPGENHRPDGSHSQTLSHNDVSSTLVLIDTDWIGSYRSNYTVTITTIPS